MRLALLWAALLLLLSVAGTTWGLVLRPRARGAVRGRALLAALGAGAGAAGDGLVFGGVKFPHPLSSSLAALGISEPSPIQKASLVALNSGLSCILHAETGSGKTLAYLLPLLKRLYGRGTLSMPVQALIVVPTKELAVQVAADVAVLAAGGGPVTAEHCSLVHLCISSSRR